MRRYFFLLLLWLPAFLPQLSAQQGAGLLLSGPMVGYCEMREALIWVQTNGPALVQIEYSAGGDNPRYRTDAYLTRTEEAYTARLIANQLRPGLEYAYTLFINGEEVKLPYATRFSTPPLWQWRSDPPALKVALGSCAYVNDEPFDRPGKPYGAEYGIFQAIHAQKPDLMLWLGDNNYLREADWYSRTGIIHRYTHSRAIRELQPLLASSANYAIWDDHDYGPNDSDYTYRGKELTSNAFRLFWGNPTYGLPGQGGITSSFEWGDAQFFLLDDRYFRDPNKKPGPRSILGEAQRQWLLDALAASTATFKFVCIGGQVLNTVAKYETYSAIAPEERKQILDFIAAQGIKNVIFLTGDRHHSELSMLEQNGIRIYDFTASPLTSGPGNAEKEENALRVKGSYLGQRNFGMIALSGPRTARKLRFSLHDVGGKEVWSLEIEAQQP